MNPDEAPPNALDRLPWPEVARRLARDARVVLPVGALEQHGPHLPLGTNTLIAQAVAERLSARLGILRAPTFPYGVNLRGSDRFAGTAGLRRKTLHRALNELLASWEDHGVTEFVVLTAHRSEQHLDALLLALSAASRTTVFDLFAIDVGDLLASDEGPTHAGELETSLLLHLAPDLVVQKAVEDAPADARTLKRYGQGRTPTPPVGTRGVVGRPSGATAGTGEAVLRRWMETLEAALRR
jgi:creatinine amidohydrolase/Fe(II)-dependent formamide hydrolase-like protein